MKIITAIYDNTSKSHPIEYILHLMLSFYRVNYQVVSCDHFRRGEFHAEDTLAITYGKERPDVGVAKQLHIYESDFFGDNYLKLASMPRTPLSKYNDIPIIYEGGCSFEGWTKHSFNIIETNIDVIASSFFMLSGYEEILISDVGAHSRSNATARLSCREGFLRRPIVNEYFEMIWQLLLTLEPSLQRSEQWPGNKEFAVAISHDVDIVRKYSWKPPVFSIHKMLVTEKKPLRAIEIAREYLCCLLNLRKDPFDTFDYMLNLEKEHGFKSSFYFMNTPLNLFASGYSLTNPVMRKLLGRIESNDCEVGLHGSYDSYDNIEMLSLEKEALDGLVSNKKYGCRQHFLRFKNPNTWRIQEKLGLLYDSSVYFSERSGFRSGFCFPFKPFDILANRVINIWELPITVMDGSLKERDYDNLTPDEGYDRLLQLIEEVRKFHGVFVLLWHNSSFDAKGGWAGWQKVYEDVLNYINQESAWVTSGREIVSTF